MVEWRQFQGAEYFLGSDPSIDSWEMARQHCQGLGADLASVPSWAVQKWLLDTYQRLDQDKWIGGRQTSGAFAWVDGAAWDYTYTECGFQVESDKQCLKMKKDRSGLWEGGSCDDATVDAFICQKGSSTSQQWTSISGAQFAHMESECVTSWQGAVDTCTRYSGQTNIATILSREMLNQIQAAFADQVN